MKQLYISDLRITYRCSNDKCASRKGFEIIQNVYKYGKIIAKFPKNAIK